MKNIDSHTGKGNWLALEGLLLEKSFEELSVSEQQLLLSCIGDKQQVLAYQQLLRQTDAVMDPQACTGLVPKPSIQAALRLKVAAKVAQKEPKQVYKNGFEPMLAAILSIFTFRHPAYSTIAMSFLAVMFWVGTNVNDTTPNSFYFEKDSLAMQVLDTAKTAINVDSLGVIDFTRSLGKVITDTLAAPIIDTAKSVISADNIGVIELTKTIGRAIGNTAVDSFALNAALKQ